MAMIEIKNISKWYGSFQVLKDCSVNVEKGEVVVVCGPSGSGKSTLIKTVNALEPFQKGEIIVDGISVGDPRPTCRAAQPRGHGVPAFRTLPPSLDSGKPRSRADEGARPRP